MKKKKKKKEKKTVSPSQTHALYSKIDGKAETRAQVFVIHTRMRIITNAHTENMLIGRVVFYRI